MKRRELLKAILPLAATPIFLGKELVGQSVKVDKDSKYVILIKPSARIDLLDFIELAKEVFPEGTPVFIGEEEDIKIFKL